MPRSRGSAPCPSSFNPRHKCRNIRQCNSRESADADAPFGGDGSPRVAGSGARHPGAVDDADSHFDGSAALGLPRQGGRAAQGGNRGQVGRAQRQRPSCLDPVQAGHRGAGAAARQSRDVDDDDLRGGAADPRARLPQPRLSVPRLRPSAPCLRRADRRRVPPPRRRQDGHRDPRRGLSRHAPGGAAQQAQGGGAGRSRRRQDADAGRTRLAAARAYARRQPGADGHAGGLSRAQDRRHRRAGEPADDLQRGEALRGQRADRAHLAHDPAGVLQRRKALLRQAQPGAAAGAGGGIGRRGQGQ